MNGIRCAPGLDKSSGDINLFGHENSESMGEMENRLSENLSTIEKKCTNYV